MIFTRRPQRVLYYYWLDANFGLMYLRLQTYFPYAGRRPQPIRCREPSGTAVRLGAPDLQDARTARSSYELRH